MTARQCLSLAALTALWVSCRRSTAPDPPPGPGFVLVGAGDIGDCESPFDEATAALLDAIPGTVFTAGDNAYPHGTMQNFLDCYEPSWGRHKARTRPAPGNHEYETSGAPAYYAYFGPSAGEPDKGYYSYDLGSWHVVVLNTNIEIGLGSPQLLWLVQDLKQNQKLCMLAVMHHPRFSSDLSYVTGSLWPAWSAMYDLGVDVAVAGHDHAYERFAPMRADGSWSRRGVRQFIVGTGGASPSQRAKRPIYNSEARADGVSGVLKLTLRAVSYSWEFVPVAGQSYSDSGTTRCRT